MGKKAKKLAKLQAQIEETRATLEELYQEVEELQSARQHKRVDQLENALEDSSEKESIAELSLEALQEARNLFGKMFETIAGLGKDPDKK